MEGKEGQIHGDHLTLAGGHTVQCTDRVSQKSTLETCVILSTKVTLINLIKNNTHRYLLIHIFIFYDFTSKDERCIPELSGKKF